MEDDREIESKCEGREVDATEREREVMNYVRVMRYNKKSGGERDTDGGAVGSL